MATVCRYTSMEKIAELKVLGKTSWRLWAFEKRARGCRYKEQPEGGKGEEKAEHQLSKVSQGQLADQMPN